MFFKPIEDTTPPVVDLAKDPSTQGIFSKIHHKKFMGTRLHSPNGPPFLLFYPVSFARSQIAPTIPRIKIG